MLKKQTKTRDGVIIVLAGCTAKLRIEALTNNKKQNKNKQKKQN
jgi:hypothetical protein